MRVELDGGCASRPLISTNVKNTSKRLKSKNIGIKGIFLRLCFLCSISVFMIILLYFSPNEHKINNTFGTPYSTTTAACKLPILNPFDSSIEQYITTPNPVNCTNSTKYPMLFTTDLHSTLIQVDDPEKYGYHSCCYRPFRKKNQSAFDIIASQNCHPIKQKKTLIPNEIEFILVKCAYLPLNEVKRRTVDMFAFVPFKNASKNPTKIPQNVKKVNTRQVNVVILGLDAVSHMNFIRTMPLTYEFLTKNLSGIGLWGYTKVADNTFPNLVPATTGLSVPELSTIANCWENDITPLDNCPFIWKTYSRQGYVTAYSEDAIGMGIFRMKGGFISQPTDYYLNTLTRKQEATIRHVLLQNAFICYGPRLGFQVLLDYMKKMAVSMQKKRRYFQFTWAGSLFHDYLNEGKLGDRFLLETLQWFKDEGYFEDTVFILMSDHGIRNDDILNVLQGKIEERMPFVYFVLPQWFKGQYGSAVGNLIENKHRLTSPFDLYETLKDLSVPESIKSDRIQERQVHLQENFKETTPRGISLFLPIPLERTCQDAAIDDQWCVCQNTWESVPVANNNRSSLITEAARSVVRFINQLITKFPQCLQLQLKEVLIAEQAFQSSKGSIGNMNFVSENRLGNQNMKLGLTFTVTPSNASFEAITSRNANGSWSVSHGIIRANSYGRESHCQLVFNLKTFCYCDPSWTSNRPK